MPDDLSPDCPPALEDAVRRLTAGEFEDGIDDEVYAVVLARSAESARAAVPDLLAAALPWLEADHAGRAPAGGVRRHPAGRGASPTPGRGPG